MLFLLVAIFAANHIDRHTIALLMQDMKVDLALTDTQLGLLTGIAFSLFYAVMGIPIARWADRGDRITVISVTTAFFSVAVAAAGAAANFVQLLLLRICAAVGEAGAQPTALSLISDRFTREERPRAVSIYMLGVPLAFIVGFLFAGWLNELFGWRLTLVCMGTPGIVLAILIRWTVRDPRREAGRRIDRENTTPTTNVPKISEVIRVLWRNRAYRFLVCGIAVQAFFVAGVLQWQPAFFVRSYGLSTGELGTWYAAVYGITGLAGTWLGGEIALRFAAGNERKQLIGIALLFAVLAAIKPFIYLMPDYRLAFALLAVVSLLSGATNGPMFAALQTMVLPSMRATATALVFFGMQLIGAGLGPLAAGMMSDALDPIFGDEALRYVLVILSPGYIFGTWFFWRAARAFHRCDHEESVDHQPSQ